MRHARRAFTLVELLIVIVVLGILVAILVPSFIGVRDNARNAQAKASVMTAYHNAKAIWALNEAYPDESTLRAGLERAEPGLRFATATPATEDPRDIWVDVDGLSGDQDITLCGESGAGRWFCLRADELGGLVSLADDDNRTNRSAVLAGEDGPMVARANADEMYQATCLLPTRGRAAGEGCYYGTGGIGWEGTEEPEGVESAPPGSESSFDEIAPINLIPPVISGQYAYGGSMSVSAGTWTPTPDSYTYQWQINHGAGWTDISGATAAVYAPAYADVGGMVRVSVRATNTWGTTEQFSDTVGPVVTPVPPTPVNLTTPVVSGTARQGEVLTTTDGAWSYTPDTYTYQWQRSTNGGSSWSDIAGATSATYTAGAGDYQALLRATVTARNGGGSASAESNSAGPVALAGIILNGDFEAPWSGSQPAVWTNESTSAPPYVGALAKGSTGGTNGPNRLRLLSPGTDAHAAARSNAFLSDGRNVFMDLAYTGAAGGEYRIDIYDDNDNVLRTGSWTTAPGTTTEVEVPMYAFTGQVVRVQITARRLAYGVPGGIWVDDVYVDPNPADPYLTIDSGISDKGWTRDSSASYTWTTFNTTGVTCTLNASPVACSGSGGTLTGLTPGSYTFSVTATNAVGSYSVERTFRVAEDYEILNGDFESGWSGSLPDYWTNHSTTYSGYNGSLVRITTGGSVGPERMSLRSTGPAANGIIRSASFVSDGRDIEVDLARTGATGGQYRFRLYDGSGTLVRTGALTNAPATLTTVTFDMLPTDAGATRMIEIVGTRAGYGAQSGVTIDGVRLAP